MNKLKESIIEGNHEAHALEIKVKWHVDSIDELNQIVMTPIVTCERCNATLLPTDPIAKYYTEQALKGIKDYAQSTR